MTDVRLPSVEGGWRTVASLIAMTMVLVLAPLSAAHGEDRLNMTVLPASDNVAAAIAWSEFAFSSAGNVVLGRSDLSPDNLAAGMLQGDLDAPLLLTPTSSLHADVEAELERLDANVVHILGGTSAISSSVESRLRAEGYSVRRYSGTTRLETAIDVARARAGTATTALLARAFGTSGDESAAWADSLAGGAWAAEDEIPVLFSQTNVLSTSTREYLESSRITTVKIVGGVAAIDASVESQLRSLGLTVQRVSGSNRFATAIEIAKQRDFDSAADATSIVLADGQNANAWAAGFAAAAYAKDKPMVLSNGASLPTETDTWFAGGTSSKSLVVAPYVTDGASKAAADKMGLLTKAAVTLDATSFANNGNVTGKVTPLTDVTSSSIAGACVTAGTLSPNATTGAFSVPVAQNFTPGACDVTITVTYKNNATTSHPFAITITGPGPNSTAMTGPELVSVSIGNQTEDHTVVKYVFDEAVTVQVMDSFKLYGFDASESGPDVPPGVGDKVRLDSTDSSQKTVLASFKKQDFLKATTAAVLAGAVKGTSTQVLNPEGSAPLQSVSFTAGRTVRPDLVSVSAPQTVNKGTTAAPEYVVRATFTFDIAADLVDINDYQLMTDAGAWRDAGSIVSGDGTTAHVVEFGKDPAGSAFDTIEDANTYAGSIRRGLIVAGGVGDRWGQVNIDQTVPIGSGTTNIPKLSTVTLLPATNQVRFTFSVAVFDPTGSKFYVYDHAGTKIQGLDAPVPTVSSADVTVRFDSGAIDGQVTAGGTDVGAADTTSGVGGTQNQTETLAAASSSAHTYSTATTLAPDLEKVIRVPSSSPDPFGGSTVTSYKVTFRFNKDVTGLAGVGGIGLKMYSSAGVPTEFQFDDGCAIGTTAPTKRDIVCDIAAATDQALFDAIKSAVIFAVERDAVDADGPDKTYSNYPTSRIPTTS